MFKFGLKLWSVNENYLSEAKRLHKDGFCDYVELYVIPGSSGFIDMWKGLDIPFVIHAPHWREGVNLAKKEKESENIELIWQAQRFADELSAEKIIVHPGIAGDMNETTRQLAKIDDKRILVENKPYFALDNGLLCNGSTPEEISFVMKETGVGFCLDVGHAICAANGHKINQRVFLKDFLELKPAMFHLSDGDVNSVYDSHKHIGEGSFDIKALLSMIPEGAMVTVETEKNSKTDLFDYVKDIQAIKNLSRSYS
jgi:deoxyribonuclease IV